MTKDMETHYTHELAALYMRNYKDTLFQLIFREKEFKLLREAEREVGYEKGFTSGLEAGKRLAWKPVYKKVFNKASNKTKHVLPLLRKN